MNNKKKGFAQLSTILDDYKVKDDKYISREFQQYGYELAEQLDDMKHKGLYIKLAKNEPRQFLEAAKRFVIDADNADNKGALFMWKLSELKKDKKNKKSKK